GVDLSSEADSVGKTIARWLGSLVSASNEGFQAGRQEILSLIDRLVDDRIRDPGSGRDVLSMLVESTDGSGEKLTREQIHDEVLTLLLAGHETTANGLAWTW